MGKSKATISRTDVAATLSGAGDRIDDAIRAGFRIQRPKGMPPALRRQDMQALATSISVAEDWLELHGGLRTERVRGALRALRRQVEDLGSEAACDYAAVRGVVVGALAG